MEECTDFEERAAIVEFEAHYSRPVAERMAKNMLMDRQLEDMRRGETLSLQFRDVLPFGPNEKRK